MTDPLAQSALDLLVHHVSPEDPLPPPFVVQQPDGCYAIALLLDDGYSTRERAERFLPVWRGDVARRGSGRRHPIRRGGRGMVTKDPPKRPGQPRHRHFRPCPCCGRWTAPYDDDPWHEGREWTSAHDCRRCDVLWTHGWHYPTGLPEDPATGLPQRARR